MGPGGREVKLWAGMLLAVGLSQMVFDVLGLTTLKGLAAATMLAPAPKVFSAVRGFETYSTAFYLELGNESVRLTPELYSRVQGPYNRRNVYGAALSYGPVLPEALRTPVMRFALCGEAPLLAELGLQNTGPVAVRFEPRAGIHVPELPLRLEAPCR